MDAPVPRSGGSERPLRIIDSHVHCSDRSDDALVPYAERNHLRYRLDELLALMQEFGVEAALLLSPPLVNGRPLSNEEVIELCQRGGGRLLPILTVEPSPDSVAAAIALEREHRGVVRGFKVRLGYVPVYPDDEVFEPLYDAAIAASLPVLFHSGDTATSSGSLVHAHPLTLDRLANRRADLRIVICHMGNPWIMDTAELVYKHQNVYTDLSGLIVGGGRYYEDYLGYLATRISEAIHFAGGAEKFLFGTDYPIQTHESSVELVRRLRIDETDRGKIFRGNAARLFRL